MPRAAKRPIRDRRHTAGAGNNTFRRPEATFRADRHMRHATPGLHGMVNSPVAETAMNTMNPYPLRVWRRLKHSFAVWHARAGLRIDLKDLTDSTLQDIGLW